MRSLGERTPDANISMVRAAGETVAFGKSNYLRMTSATWPVKVRFAAKDYESREFIFDESLASELFRTQTAILTRHCGRSCGLRLRPR